MWTVSHAQGAWGGASRNAPDTVTRDAGAHMQEEISVREDGFSQNLLPSRIILPNCARGEPDRARAATPSGAGRRRAVPGAVGDRNPRAGWRGGA